MTLWWFEVAAAHERPLKRLFIAPRCSCAYMFCMLTVAIAVIVPFFAAFGAGGFWLKMQVYHETPEVRFGHEYLLMLEGTTAESNKVWSSQSDINDALGATTPPIARYDFKNVLYDVRRIEIQKSASFQPDFNSHIVV